MSIRIPTVLNVISGKGGTGKTLLACVLADMLGNSSDTRVLVVDLDFFVRGLTSLLYFHQEERLTVSPQRELTVSDVFIQKRVTGFNPAERLAVIKYRSFDVLPAVSRIDALLNFQDLSPDNRTEATSILRNLLDHIPPGYRFIILDSRAGYDELIAATHELSDASLIVEEQDPISKVTADNLYNQLRSDSSPPIFRLVNKVRGIRFESQLQTARGVTDLGSIPFDMDVMNSFGSGTFWEDITRSLYRSALARAWNVLSGKLDLGVELRLPRVSPVASERLEAQLGIVSSKDRVILMYGFLLGIVGLGYGLFGREIVQAFREDPLRAISVGAGLIGVALTLSVYVRQRAAARQASATRTARRKVSR